ncbi:response regulator transcription factor [Rugosimonospora africana]|uniref:Transcriptional regulator n=1 Tax=Rugosimonospora africana TaxID=556532 RepID=A0A8J3QZU0_9ACTN|nr:response regulator transcription factor [Rugosimonospora africana]GIH20370.1 transcriptional regulator [Rugosimonospora africana]
MTQDSRAEPPRLLVMEDDSELAEMLATLLGGNGFAVDVAEDGQRGLHFALSRRYNVMLIDRRLPAIDGLEVLIRLRRRAVTTRALMLTALGDLADRVDGLNAGADDYLVKPFEVDELVARVRALNRRFLDEAQLVPVGDGFLNMSLHEVTLPDGRRVALSPREFELLRMLAVRPGAIHSRDQLRSRLFEDTSAESIVDTYVYYLRRKLGSGVIRTVRGFGYQIGAL